MRVYKKILQHQWSSNFQTSVVREWERHGGEEKSNFATDRKSVFRENRKIRIHNRRNLRLATLGIVGEVCETLGIAFYISHSIVRHLETTEDEPTEKNYKNYLFWACDKSTCSHVKYFSWWAVQNEYFSDGSKAFHLKCIQLLFGLPATKGC